MILYNLCIHILAYLVKVTGLFNSKFKSFVKERKGLLANLKVRFKGVTDPVIWIHCASLGEFEQGRSVIKRFRSEFPSYKVLLTFFSSSGFEVRKDYEGVDFVFYLPWDTTANAREFISITNPCVAIFVKYEFWFNYFNELQKKQIPILSVSAIFRQNQIYFKTYGQFFRSILKKVNHFFVQNQSSLTLLNSISIKNATLSGNTRFDRVHELVMNKSEVPIAKNFKGGESVFVVGSCWPEDFDILAPFIDSQKGKLKFIIAPHKIDSSFLIRIEAELQVKTIRYSKVNDNLESANVLIVDNVGLLSRLYQYGEYAYIGGAFGKGLHNILEAACYGIPIFFGDKNYKKFQEATDLIVRGGAFKVNDYMQLVTKYQALTNQPESYLLACEITKAYVEENIGATEKVIAHCHKLLSQV